MSDDGKVVRLVTRASGISVSDTDDLMKWGTDWLAALARDAEDGSIPSPTELILVVRTADGRVATLSQATGALSGTEVIGLLTLAATLRSTGAGTVHQLYADDEE